MRPKTLISGPRSRVHVRSGLSPTPSLILLLGLSLVGGLGVAGTWLPSGLLTRDTPQTIPDSIVAYGPKQFGVPGGGTVLHVESFPLTIQPGATYSLVLENGAGGQNRVTSATLVLNGDTLFSGTYGTPDVRVFTTPPIDASNDLQLSVTGSDGSFVTATLWQSTTAEYVVYGPVEFIRQGPQPAPVVFTVSGAAPPHKIFIQNGYPDSTALVTSGSVTLNSVTIFSPDDFSSTTYELTGTVTLQAVDTLSVSMGPNTRMAVYFTAQDTTPPGLTLSTPADSAVVGDSTVTVTGTVTDITTVQVASGGVFLPVDSTGAFSGDVPLPAEGSNQVTVTATDAAGNMTASSVTVIRDTQSPNLTVTEPTDGAGTSATKIAVNGTVTDSSDVTVTINGVGTSVDGNGAFTDSVTLQTGPNTITVIATDEPGNQTIVVRTVYLDTDDPVLTVSTPADGFVTSADSVFVSGSVMDASPVSVDVNAIPLPLDPSDNFADSVALAYGLNVLTVTALDAAGNDVSVQRLVTRDTLPPELVVSAPPNPHTTTDDSVVVTGTVTDSTALVLTIDGDTVVVQGNGSFSDVSYLVMGENTITVRATDAAGLQTTVPLTVTRGIVLPPDPSTVAPAINTTVATSLATATAFLYTGEDPIQTGVTPGTIEPRQVAVLKGRVLDRAGSPLSGVTVTAPSQPEFGQTTTRTDGAYDFVVNGGGSVTLSFSRSGYISAQRKTSVPWQDYRVLGDVVLIEPDTIVTTIDFTDPIQVARGSVSTDGDGSRQATILFRGGTVATMALPGGGLDTLTSLSVRATEFTVGATGPNAMPGELPPSSGYTYAVDLSADEATDGERVDFDTPQPVYVENYLGFDVGDAVPVGYYDETEQAWVPYPDGVVLEIVDTVGGVASIDMTGDGFAEHPDTLAARLGINSDELEALASLYAPGATLWRTQVPHFSIWDFNWGALKRWICQNLGICAPESPPPTENAEEESGGPCDPPGGTDQNAGSWVICQNQTLGETLPIAGTPFTLNYLSSRAPGWAPERVFTVPIRIPEFAPGTDSVPFADPDLIIVESTIAGRQFVDTVPGVDQDFDFAWDGLDAYGRLLAGKQPISVRIGYVYPEVWWSAPYDGSSSFGEAAPSSPTVVETGTDRTMTFYSTPTVGKIGQPGAVSVETGSYQFGAWSLDAHHVYDPLTRVLYMGDGRKVDHRDDGPSIFRFAGNGTWESSGTAGYGSPALESPLPQIGGIVVGRDGSLYLGDFTARIRKIDAETGIISLFAGGGPSGNNGDGFLATEARLERILDLAWGPDGSLYFVSDVDDRARRVAPDGRVYTVAGTYFAPGSSGDGGPATAAKLHNPSGIAVASDGTVYIADLGNEKIRRVGTDGIITTVAANIFRLRDLDVLPNGDVVYSHELKVSVLGVDGTVTDLAGGGVSEQDGLPGTEQSLLHPWELAVGQDGVLYVSQGIDEKNRIKAIQPNGVMTTIAGAGPRGDQAAELGDGGPALKALFHEKRAIATSPGGDLYVYPDASFHIRVVKSQHEGFSGGDIAIPSPDGASLFHFDAQGRHLETFDASTGVRLYAFAYDSLGLLSSVTDRDGLETTIARDTTLITITGPYGHATELTQNVDGYLQRFEGPESQIHTFTYHTGGLLESQTDPRGYTSGYEYDADGRVDEVTDQAMGVRTYTRSDADSTYTVTSSTPLGRLTDRTVRRSADGSVWMTTTDPAGFTDVSVHRPDASDSLSYADGTVVTSTNTSDLPLNVSVVQVDTTTVRLPSGLISSVVTTVTRTLDSIGVPLSTNRTETTIRQIGSTGAWEVTEDADSAVVRVVSPEGRATKVAVDTLGRAVASQNGTDSVVSIGRDGQGRITSAQQASRLAVFSYDNDGQLDMAIDPGGDTTRFYYDSAGRVTRQVLADTSEIRITYDARSNVDTIVTPRGPVHAFEYSPVNLMTAYRPPAVDTLDPATYFGYNADRALTSVTRPDGVTLTAAYDTAGRIEELGFPGALIEVGYDSLTGEVSGVNGPYGGGVAMSYDGALLAGVEWIGDVAGTVEYAYDSALRLSAISVNGLDSVRYAYDEDDLLLQAGDISLQRDAASGRITGTSLGDVTTAQGYNGLGELTNVVWAFDGSPLLADSLNRDALGRIDTKIEIVGVDTTTYVYTYDEIGRLTQVTTDSVVTEAYEYDENGNRSSSFNSAGSVTATFDAQDRLLTHGAREYAYSAAGELTTLVEGADTTRYSYDPLGNLLSVELPNDTTVEYLVDGAGRRVGRRINGAFDRGWLYQDGLNPLAEVDSTGAVVNRFVYGSRSFVPDYMLRGDDTLRIVTDERGSVRMVVDVSTGNVLQELVYDAFGRVLVDTDPGYQPFGYGGGVYDQATGLVRFGARDYDATVGRWTAKDPLGLAGGLNLYAHAQGDPLNLMDVTGTSPVLIGEAILTIGGVGSLGGVAVVGAGFFAIDALTGSHVSRGILDWLRNIPGGKLVKDIMDELFGDPSNVPKIPEGQDPDPPGIHRPPPKGYPPEKPWWWPSAFLPLPKPHQDPCPPQRGDFPLGGSTFG